MVWIVLILVLAPSVGLLVYFYLRDQYEPEPRGHVVRAFFYGFLVLVPAVYAGRWLARLVEPEFLALGGIGADFYRIAVMVALPEEGVKLALFAVTILRWKEFDEPFDGIVYGVALALGFATIENTLYVVGAQARGDLPVRVAALRAVLAVPAHALYGATMGYFLGRAKFAVSCVRRGALTFLGFLFSWIFHTGYDWSCELSGDGWGWTLVALFSAAMWIFVLLLLPKALAASPFKPQKLQRGPRLRPRGGAQSTAQRRKGDSDASH
jgi:RsiW-degrading membrane proteinase PrsW (M82 family)